MGSESVSALPGELARKTPASLWGSKIEREAIRTLVGDACVPRLFIFLAHTACTVGGAEGSIPFVSLFFYCFSYFIALLTLADVCIYQLPSTTNYVGKLTCDHGN